MIPEVAFVRFLKESTALNTAVGGRVFPIAATMSQRMPFVVYNRINTTRPTHLLGDSGLVYVVWQLDIFAKSYQDAKTVAELIRNRCHGYIGPITDGTDSIGCDMAINAERDGYVHPTDASDTGTFRVSMDIDVSLSEPLTTNT